jgi:hypothetical protein
LLDVAFRRLRDGPVSLAGEAGLRFGSGAGPSRTLRERFARRLPEQYTHLGTVRGSFRPLEAGTGSTKTLRLFRFFADFIGAGEGIRTLDPNLGKVVLYP